MGMRRSDSLSHVESAMSSVKSLRGRGLDLPHTGRWLRRKHRYASRFFRRGGGARGWSRAGFVRVCLRRRTSRLDRAGRASKFKVQDGLDPNA